MSQSKNNRLEFLENILTVNKIMTISEMVRKSRCSKRTLWRDIEHLSVVTSYSHKSQYATLSTIPKYNDDGIWEYESVLFTKFKSSLELILNIIERSMNGITQKEISEKMKINISKQMQILLKRGLLNRIKVGRQYYYISEKVAKNKQAKLKFLNVQKLEEHFDKSIKLTDLIALLKMALLESKVKKENLKKLIKKHSISISEEKAWQIILKYDLIQKKSR